LKQKPSFLYIRKEEISNSSQFKKIIYSKTASYTFSIVNLYLYFDIDKTTTTTTHEIIHILGRFYRKTKQKKIIIFINTKSSKI
jgi:hypothetical protein